MVQNLKSFLKSFSVVKFWQNIDTDSDNEVITKNIATLIKELFNISSLIEHWALVNDIRYHN